MRKLLFLMTSLFQFCVINSQNIENIKAEINLFRKDIFVMIDAVVENNDHIYKDALSYHLLTLKRVGNSNSYEKEEQSGSFNILPNQKKTITTTKLTIEPNQEVKIYLFIKNNGNLLSQDVIIINEIESILQTTSIEEDEIEIKGLVVENVKTKIGKDFYDVFYQMYNSSGAKYSFVINVNEKPFIGGRGSLVSVEIGSDKIFEFQARPDEDLLKKAATYTLTLIENYNKNRKNYEKIY